MKTQRQKQFEAWESVIEGRESKKNTVCPYGISSMRSRAAWLAGHYDTHGKESWERARQ